MSGLQQIAKFKIGSCGNGIASKKNNIECDIVYGIIVRSDIVRIIQ